MSGGAVRPIIQVDRINHWFDAIAAERAWALKDVSLKVAPGEFICLLGPSGCGKTTLLNIIAGFLFPSEGVVLLDEREIDGPGPDRGVVFQDYSLFPWLTILENVAFGLRMQGESRKARSDIARHHLAMVGLEQAASRYPVELSGGMRQRAAIARALATDPRVLLMDEPFAALDAMTRGSLQTLLLELQVVKKQTIIFVTHNIAEAVYLADRVVVMSPNPGSIALNETIAAPRPRGRASHEFASLYSKLETAIGAAAGE